MKYTGTEETGTFSSVFAAWGTTVMVLVLTLTILARRCCSFFFGSGEGVGVGSGTFRDADYFCEASVILFGIYLG